MVKAAKIRLVESAVERTARLLSQQFGIRVVWQHGECKTNGKIIYLPTLPDDAPDELLAAVHGYLDHETAHILFTDFESIKNSANVPNESQMHCINVIEDFRIERKLGSIFPGSPLNLRAARDWLMPQISKNWNNVEPFYRVCVAVGDVMNYGHDTDLWKESVDDVTKDLVKECLDAIGPLEDLQSTADCMAAGFRMWDVLKDLAPPPKPAQKQVQSATGSGKGKGKSSAQASSAGSKQSSKQENKDSSQPASSMEDLGKLLSDAAKANCKGNRGYTHDQDSDKTYLVFTTSGDTIEPVPDSRSPIGPRRLQRFRDETVGIANTVRTKLVNSLRSKTHRRWVGNKEEGKINSRQLFKAVLNIDDKVYKQLSDKVHLNTAVMLAIDHSASMDGQKIDLAARSAILIGDALNALKVPFAVYGYSTSGPGEKPPTDQKIFARWSKLWIGYYRDFDQPWERGAEKLIEAKLNIQHNTLDSESVKHGIQRLLQRKEKRKILFVFNDGMPFPGHGHIGRCQQHLKDVVASAAASGIEIVAFGIEDDNVKNYYPNYVVLNDVHDLISEPLKLLDAMLRKGVTKR